jgi:hypothetical protein
MKYISIAILLFVFANLTQSQLIDKSRYRLLQIQISPSYKEKLTQLGVSLDEGSFNEKGYFTGAFNDWEEQQLVSAGVKYRVIHEDAEKEFIERNKRDILLYPNPTAPSVLSKSNCDYAVPEMFELGTMGGYLKYEEMLAALDSMHARYPALCSKKIPISNTQKTFEGRPLYYVKISDRVNKDEVQEPKVLYTAVHHAREAITMIQLIYFMEYILENYDSDPVARKIINNCELFFVPCVNPDGYMYNQTTQPDGGGMWRKNRRKEGQVKNGVDLNRNYGFEWGRNNGSSGNANSDTYRGPAPFSEAETELIRQLSIDKKFTTSMHHHSYAEILFYPFDYTNEDCPDAVLMKRAGDSLTACNNYEVQHGAGSLGYLASGTAPDWMYGENVTKPTCYSFTNEIGGNSFWPSRSRIIPLCQEQVLLNTRLALFALSFNKKPFSGKIQLNSTQSAEQ